MEQVLFSFAGNVIAHKGRGKTLGYPTANIALSNDLPEGIYIGYTIYNTIRYPSLIFIGAPLTFKEKDKKAEIFLLDFDQDIYGEYIEAEVVKKIRDNRRFDTPEELVMRMNLDLQEAREYFKLQENSSS
jgi:riboflavin kinase/FMN adenylyltransferase